MTQSDDTRKALKITQNKFILNSLITVKRFYILVYLIHGKEEA